MNAVEIIKKKRNGGKLSKEEINFFEKIKQNIVVDCAINTVKQFKGLKASVAVKDIFDTEAKEPARSTSDLITTRTEGRKIIGKITYIF